MSALSAAISGMGNSRISVLPGPVRTAASTLSTVAFLRRCSDNGGEFLMLAPSRKQPGRLEAASRLKAWARSRFSLAADATLLVSEIESAQAGFPPLSTVVAFWTAERKHYHFRVFKPLEAVAEADIPPARYRETLAVTPGVDCGCC